MGKVGLMVYCLQNIFTVIISFDSQNGFWWRQSDYYGFIMEKPQFIEVPSLARTRWAKATVIELASMALDYKFSVLYPLWHRVSQGWKTVM